MRFFWFSSLVIALFVCFSASADPKNTAPHAAVVELPPKHFDNEYDQTAHDMVLRASALLNQIQIFEGTSSVRKVDSPTNPSMPMVVHPRFGLPEVEQALAAIKKYYIQHGKIDVRW